MQNITEASVRIPNHIPKDSLFLWGKGWGWWPVSVR